MASKETDSILQYLYDSEVPHRITCITRHSAKTAAGNPSRHVAQGTGGKGLAVDVAGPTYGRDTQYLADIFTALDKVRPQLHELIYAGPQVSYNIKNGKQVKKYAEKGHHDHVHVSVDRGIFIVWPGLSVGEKLLRIPNSRGFCVLSNDDLVITDKEGAIFSFNAAGEPKGKYIDAYNRHPKLGAGKDPRECIGVYAQGQGYVQVFDDGKRYRWGV